MDGPVSVNKASSIFVIGLVSVFFLSCNNKDDRLDELCENPLLMQKKVKKTFDMFESVFKRIKKHKHGETAQNQSGATFKWESEEERNTTINKLITQENTNWIDYYGRTIRACKLYYSFCHTDFIEKPSAECDQYKLIYDYREQQAEIYFRDFEKSKNKLASDSALIGWSEFHDMLIHFKNKREQEPQGSQRGQVPDPRYGNLFELVLHKLIERNYTEARNSVKKAGEASGTDLAYMNILEGVIYYCEHGSVSEAMVYFKNALATLPSSRQERADTVIAIIKFQKDYQKNGVRMVDGSHNQLKSVGDMMNRLPTMAVLVEGRTDSYGTTHYNLNVSIRRANAVKKYLVSQYNILPDRIQTVGYADSRPIDSLSTPQGRELNRSASIVILNLGLQSASLTKAFVSESNGQQMVLYP